jgi:hypothetical protein
MAPSGINARLYAFRGDGCIVRQVVDERNADAGPLQALMG